METMPTGELRLDETNREYLYDTARWAKFLAIVGFIMCALLVVIGLFAGTMMSNMSSRMQDMQGFGDSNPGAGMGMIMTIFYILIAVLYFFPCLYLYRFSTGMIDALADNDQGTLTSSFSNLKACFKFVGILTIIILCLYGVAIVGLGLGMATR
jgi:hypothetical protein